MITRGIILIILLTPACGFALTAQNPAQPAKQKPAPKLDLYGDPLPEGAVARLGTVRWRCPSRIVAFALGGKLIVTGQFGFSGGLCLFDAGSGRPLQRINGPVASLLAVSPDDKIVVNDRGCVFDVVQGKEIQKLESPPDRVLGLAFSSDGLTVAAADMDANVYVWAVNTGKQLRIIESGAVLGLTFSPDGKRLSGFDGGSLRFWEVATGKELAQFPLKLDNVGAIAFAQDGKSVAIATMDGVELVDVETLKTRKKITSYLPSVLEMALSPDGRFVVASCPFNEMHLWDTETQKELGEGELNGYGFAFSPDGKVLATVGGRSYSNAIQRWDVKTGKEIDPPKGHVSSAGTIRFGQDSVSLTSRGLDGKILRWDTRSSKITEDIVGSFIWPPKKAKNAWHIEDIAADERHAILCGNFGPKSDDQINIAIWDAVDKKLRHLSEPSAFGWTGRFSSDGKLVGGQAGNGIFRVWNAASGKVEFESKNVQMWTLSPDNRLLAFAPFTEALNVLDLQNGKVLHRLDGIHRWAFSPDSKLLAIAAKPNHIVLMDAATGKDLHRWERRPLLPEILEFSEDGRMFIFATDGNLCVWDIAAGKEILTVSAPNSRCGPVAFSPSGRVLAVGRYVYKQVGKVEMEYVHSIQLWDLPSKKEIRRLFGGQGNVTGLAFSPDGRLLASAGEDSTILLWEMANAK